MLEFYPRHLPIIGGGDGISAENWRAVITVDKYVQLNPPDDYENKAILSYTVTFNGRLRTVQIGTTEYKLEAGNIFIVTLDEMFVPSIEQLAEQYKGYDKPQQLLDIIKRSKPNDQRVQALKLNK